MILLTATGEGKGDQTSLQLPQFLKTNYRYGHDDHGGGYGKGGGGYDDHRKVDNEGKVHWVGGGEEVRGGIEHKRGEEERDFHSGGPHEAEEYSRLGREAYKAGRREGGREADGDGEVYSAAQGPGYSYSHHRRREEMEKEGPEEKGVSSDYHLSPPRYQQHRSAGAELSPPQYGDSFPGYQPLTPSRR